VYEFRNSSQPWDEEKGDGDDSDEDKVGVPSSCTALSVPDSREEIDGSCSFSSPSERGVARFRISLGDGMSGLEGTAAALLRRGKGFEIRHSGSAIVGGRS